MSFEAVKSGQKVYIYHEQRSYKGRSDFSWPSIVNRHTSRPGKFRYNTFYVLLIIMNFVSFALGVARSLTLLVSLLEALSFKRSGAPSVKRTKTALVPYIVDSILEGMPEAV